MYVYARNVWKRQKVAVSIFFTSLPGNVVFVGRVLKSGLGLWCTFIDSLVE